MKDFSIKIEYRSDHSMTTPWLVSHLESNGDVTYSTWAIYEIALDAVREVIEDEMSDAISDAAIDLVAEMAPDVAADEHSGRRELLQTFAEKLILQGIIPNPKE